jgi:hypothetical protein
MLTAIAVLVGALVPVAVLLATVEAIQRRRARVVSRQIMVTDAVHAELGAVVAPLVEKHAFRPWRVIFPIADRRAPEIGRLVAITDRVFRGELRPTEDVHIVFTRAA